MVKALIALVPSAGVLFLFVVAVKAMLEGDRRERTAQARWDRQQEQAHDMASPAADATPNGPIMPNAHSEPNRP